MSQASANQRAGRAGRVRAGKAYRLYTGKNYGKSMDHQLHSLSYDNIAFMNWKTKKYHTVEIFPNSIGNIK